MKEDGFQAELEMPLSQPESFSNSGTLSLKKEIYRQTGLVIEDESDIKGGIQKAFGQLAENFLVLNAATGLGKTRMVLNHCAGKKVLIVCKQVTHFETWNAEIKKWNLHPSECKIICYNSLHKLTGEQYDVVVLDEAQRVSSLTIEALRGLKWLKLIACSATIPKEKMALLYQLGKPRVVNIPVEKAIKWKLIPVPNIVVIDRPLDLNNRYLVFQRHRKGFKENLTIDYPLYNHYKTKPINLNIRCSEIEYYQLLEEAFQYERRQFFSNPDVEWQKNRFLQAGGMRKHFLANLKTGLTKKIIDKLSDQRLVVFANSIAQCEQLAGGHVAVHSKAGDVRDTVEKFNNYEIDRLFACKMLDESVNLVGEFTAIIVALGGSDIQACQRLGRSLRHKDSKIIIIRSPFSRDDAYFEKFKKGLSDDFFTFLKLDEL